MNARPAPWLPEPGSCIVPKLQPGPGNANLASLSSQGLGFLVWKVCIVTDSDYKVGTSGPNQLHIQIPR